MEHWTDKYDYPMSDDFWRDAVKLHTGNDPYSSDNYNKELLYEIREVKALLEELLIELRETKENRYDRPQKTKEKPARKSRGVEL